MFQHIDGIPVWGDPDPKSVEQIRRASREGDVAGAALMADHHYGYGVPIGGVLAYRDMVSPSGVGFDIACGNKAMETPVRGTDLLPDLAGVMDTIASSIEFGVGGRNRDRDAQDDAVFDDPRWESGWATTRKAVRHLRDLARTQLGTVGGGNHYVDLLVDDATDHVWVACHFGSRGFGHKTATGFMNIARGGSFTDKAGSDSMDAAPLLLDLSTDAGQAYVEAMELAGAYAYAGRDYVVRKVLEILGTEATASVHVHHNFAWKERHDGEDVWVVRKGATPIRPGERAFIGGSMCDHSAIVEGVEGSSAAPSLCSAPHGAGRVMGRMQAKGKTNWKTGEVIREGLVTEEMMQGAVREYGIELRGGDLDESPFVYRMLEPVLAEHDNLRIAHLLRPIGVCMAPRHVRDPYKD
jgi:tRNA-splicing ligase RtcB (3'-phosphate/5'-hydroxy nucleic acid ligase)